MKNSVIGCIFSIMAAITYLVAIIIMITAVDTRNGLSGGETVVVLSAASVIFALIGMTNNQKAKNDECFFQTASMMISDIIIIVGVGTATIFSLELWG